MNIVYTALERFLFVISGETIEYWSGDSRETEKIYIFKPRIKNDNSIPRERNFHFHYEESSDDYDHRNKRNRHIGRGCIDD